MFILTQFCAWVLHEQLCHTAAVEAVTSIYLSSFGLQSGAHVVWVQESKLVFSQKIAHCEFNQMMDIRPWTGPSFIRVNMNLFLEWIDPFNNLKSYSLQGFDLVLVWGEMFVLYIG